MITAQEILNQSASYVVNEISFSEFEDWLIDHSWDMHKDQSSLQAQELVHDVNELVFQFLDHVLDEQALKDQLLSIINQQVAELNVNPEAQPAIQVRWKNSVLQTHRQPLRAVV